jgi:hypothetical protein
MSLQKVAKIGEKSPNLVTLDRTWAEFSNLGEGVLVHAM